MSTNQGNLLSYSFSNKLRAIVGADVVWNASQDEQVRQGVNDIGGVELALDVDRQTFSGILVDDVQYPEGFAIIRTVMHEVVRPNMVLVQWLAPVEIKGFDSLRYSEFQDSEDNVVGLLEGS